jgi:hypothetical protein
MEDIFFMSAEQASLITGIDSYLFTALPNIGVWHTDVLEDGVRRFTRYYHMDMDESRAERRLSLSMRRPDVYPRGLAKTTVRCIRMMKERGLDGQIVIVTTPG